MEARAKAQIWRATRRRPIEHANAGKALLVTDLADDIDHVISGKRTSWPL